jgi:hypothetical protein
MAPHLRLRPTWDVIAWESLGRGHPARLAAESDAPTDQLGLPKRYADTPWELLLPARNRLSVKELLGRADQGLKDWMSPGNPVSVVGAAH